MLHHQTADSENNIFGRTRNPRKLNLTAGGSSGGEGSLVAFRGAILGVGTDIAGSIRIPSLCCGTYGFKPTANRVPFGGQASPAMPGLPGILPSAGPLATCAADLELFFQCVLAAQPWTDDASAFAVPYQTIAASPFTEGEKGVLTIGILPEDPSLPWHPPVRRALECAVSVLNAAGHTTIQIPLSFATSASKAWDLAYKFFSLDPNHTGIQHIRDSGEPMIKTVATNWEMADNEAFHQKYRILDLAAMNVERSKYFEAWREVFVTNKFDVVIAPVAQHTAVKHDTYGSPGYTTIWNLLDVSESLYPPNPSPNVPILSERVPIISSIVNVEKITRSYCR
jgi:amidase